MDITIDGTNIYSCTKEQLREVQSHLKQAWSLADQKAVTEFFPGQKVTFMHRGKAIEAEVVRPNKTSVSVSSPIGSYKVSPALLTKL